MPQAKNSRFDRYIRWLSSAQKDAKKATLTALWLGGFPYLIQDDSPITSAYARLDKEISTLPVPAEAKETTKLTVAAHYGAQGEIGWLSNPSQIKALAPEQVQSIIEGKKPEHLTRAGSAAYDAVTYLVAVPGSLPQKHWEECIEALGKDGTIGIIHLVGMHIGASIIANAVDAPVGGKEEGLAVKEE